MFHWDQRRWLSYQELGKALGCTANAARMHAMRRNWSRRSPNRAGDSVRVLVPEVTIVRPCVTHGTEQYDTRPSGPQQENVRAPADAQSVLLINCAQSHRDNPHPPQNEGLRSPSRQPGRPAARISKETIAMRDLTADWQKWSSAERFLAVVLVLVLIGLPLRFLITTAPL